MLIGQLARTSVRHQGGQIMAREMLDIRAIMLTAVSLMLAGSPLLANDVEVTGTLGSPSATTTISGKQ